MSLTRTNQRTCRRLGEKGHSDEAGPQPMTARTRKLAGTVILVVFLAVYALLAMVAATAVPINSNKFAELIYFIIAGTIWIVPAGILIKWMQKP